MHRSFLIAATLVAAGSAEHSFDENMYQLDTYGNFLKEYERAWLNDEIGKFPSCITNAVSYMDAYNQKCTGTTSDCGTDPTVVDECCRGTQLWDTLSDGCENFQGDPDKICCMPCVDSTYGGFPFECTPDFTINIHPDEIICDTTPLTVDVAPLSAGTKCRDEQIVITGEYENDDTGKKQTPNCDFWEQLVINENKSGQTVFDSDNMDVEALMEAGAMRLRPTIVNGEVIVTIESECNIFLSAQVNGKFEFNPTNTTPAMNTSSLVVMYNTTLYANRVMTINQGNFVMMGGKNMGEILFDSSREATFRNVTNPSSGVIRVNNVMEFIMGNMINNGLISARSEQAYIKTVHTHALGKMEFDGGEVVALNMTNEGDILVKSGTKCILEFYMNYGTVTIEDGAECYVYLNVNEHTGSGTLNVPTNGVMVIQGDYIEPVRLPMAEYFGKWTTGAYRAGKSRWVGDKGIMHGDCDQLRFNTLGMRSIVQSPSYDAFNAVVEITHPKRQMNVDMSYINVTLYDENDVEWHFSRYLFEDSDIITHLELPEIGADRLVTASMDNFRIIVSIDFMEYGIPKSNKNDVEITMFSLRQGHDELKMDALDCVELHDVGVAYQDNIA